MVFGLEKSKLTYKGLFHYFARCITARDRASVTNTDHSGTDVFVHRVVGKEEMEPTFHTDPSFSS